MLSKLVHWKDVEAVIAHFFNNGALNVLVFACLWIQVQIALNWTNIYTSLSDKPFKEVNRVTILPFAYHVQIAWRWLGIHEFVPATIIQLWKCFLQVDSYIISICFCRQGSFFSPSPATRSSCFSSLVGTSCCALDARQKNFTVTSFTVFLFFAFVGLFEAGRRPFEFNGPEPDVDALDWELLLYEANNRRNSSRARTGLLDESCCPACAVGVTVDVSLDAFWTTGELIKLVAAWDNKRAASVRSVGCG